MKTILSLSLCLLFLGGCASLGTTSGAGDGPAGVSDELHEIRAALVDGRTDAAERRLELIGPALAGDEKTYAALLLAEVRLQQECPQEALDLARGVLAENPDDPAAHEIAGKALLKLGRFDDAERHFAGALAAPGLGPASAARLEDLTAVSRGLAAWSRADPELARSYWQSIGHAGLRYELDKSLRDQTQTALARQP